MRSIEQIKNDIIQTKLEIQKRKEMSSDWRIGRDMYDLEMITERDEYFQIAHYANEIIKSDQPRIDELKQLNLEDHLELELLIEHHRLLIELLMNFFR